MTAPDTPAQQPQPDPAREDAGRCYQLVIGRDGRAYVDLSKQVPMDMPVRDMREEMTE